MPVTDIRYLSRPYVCGAIGPVHPTTMRLLVRASPVPVTQVLDQDDGQLWSSGQVESWQAAREHGHIWSSYAQGHNPATWQDVAGEQLASGLAWTEDGPVVHNDALGLGEIYVRRHDRVLYFASRIEPLLEIDEAPLHVDWTAWACILSLGGPLHDATPFMEIRRIGPSSGWRATRQGLQSITFEPAFLSSSANGAPPDPADLIERMRQGMSRAAGAGRVNITFSGGWDSRLLGALASEASSRRVRAWTTSPDDGYDLDIALSKPVARALRMKHHVHVPGPDAWVASLDVARHRLQHQTWMHTWLMPLAAKLHGRPGLLLDGLGGDVLLKSLFVARRHLVSAASDEGRRLLWDGLGGSRLGKPGLLTASAAAGIAELSWEAFRGATAHVAQHPAGPALSVLLTRTSRSVGASPNLMFGPECDVVLPFLNPDFMAEALRVPAGDKIGGDYYRLLLESVAGRRIAELPSTNDKGITPEVRRPQRQTSEASLRRLTAETEGDDAVRQMLGPLLRRNGEHVAVNTPGHVAALQALSMFAAWQRRYDHLLAPEASPW